MNTTELVAKLAEAHGVSKAQAKSIVDDILKDIVDAATSGAEVSLPGFGKFKVKATPEREGRNPASGEKIKIAASKKLTFSSAKSVKDVLNGEPKYRRAGSVEDAPSKSLAQTSPARRSSAISVLHPGLKCQL